MGKGGTGGQLGPREDTGKAAGALNRVATVEPEKHGRIPLEVDPAGVDGEGMVRRPVSTGKGEGMGKAGEFANPRFGARAAGGIMAPFAKTRYGEHVSFWFALFLEATNIGSFRGLVRDVS